MAKEIEEMFIAYLENINDLNKADDIIDMEQWELKTSHTKQNGIQGTIRMRREGGHFVMATKVFHGVGNATEHEEDVSEATFKCFKKLCPLGAKKKRHIFNIPGTPLKWEMDVYYRDNGEPIRWVKFDLEHDGSLSKVPPFPVPVKSVIGAKNRTEKEEEFVARLFSEHFLIYSSDSILPIDEATYSTESIILGPEAPSSIW